MSINEIEAKARELRQLQALIEEAQAEAEAIKDAIKAAMGDSESVQAGEYRIHGGRYLLQNRHQRPQKDSPGCGGALHQGDCHAAVRDKPILICGHPIRHLISTEKQEPPGTVAW